MIGIHIPWLVRGMCISIKSDESSGYLLDRGKQHNYNIVNLYELFELRGIMERYFEINAIFSKFSKNYMELKKDLPVRPSEMGVLNILSATPGPHTSVMLAEMLGVSKPMITAHLTSLVEKGYVIKERSEEDGRVYYVLLTEKGQALVERAKKYMGRHIAFLAAEMGQEDFERLLNLAQRANQILEGNKKTGNEPDSIPQPLY